MSVSPWDNFLQTLQSKRDIHGFSLAQETASFAGFVKNLPEPDRVSLLLHAYDQYRALGACQTGVRADRFESSCYSILISSILATKIRPTETEALAILRKSFHQCGHGSDVEPPLTLAERAFENRPYSPQLFDAVEAYKETLRPLTSTTANDIKRKLNWVLWHDPRRVEKKCWTRRIQTAIHAMDSPSHARWQWLLRNTAAGLKAEPSKGWIKEGKKRLTPIGEEELLQRLDEWFTFPEQQVSLSAPGSAMLRLLVWYASLVDVARSLPIVARVAHVSWAKPEPAQKVISAIAWLLRIHGGSQFDSEIGVICRNWSDQSAEVKRLEETYLPAQALEREQREQEASEQRKKEMQARLQVRLSGITGMLERVSALTGHPAPEPNDSNAPTDLDHLHRLLLGHAVKRT